jgi:hypothetical protein
MMVGLVESGGCEGVDILVYSKRKDSPILDFCWQKNNSKVYNVFCSVRLDKWKQDMQDLSCALIALNEPGFADGTAFLIMENQGEWLVGSGVCAHFSFLGKSSWYSGDWFDTLSDALNHYLKQLYIVRRGAEELKPTTKVDFSKWGL